MNLQAVVILVSLGACIAVGGKTIVSKTGQGTVAAARAVHVQKLKVVTKPFVWAAKRVVK